jgi:competence protein ComEC
VRAPPDLRLFGLALGMWGACIAALHLSAALAVVVGLGAAGAATGIGWWTAARARHRPAAHRAETSARGVARRLVARLLAVRTALTAPDAAAAGRVGAKATHPATAHSTTAHSATAHPATAHSTIRRTEVARPEVARPATAQPTITHPATARASVASWAVVGVLIGVVCGAACTAARTVSREAEPLASLARDGATGEVELTITDDPRPVASRLPGPSTFLVDARLSRVDMGGGPVRLDARVLVFATDTGWRALLPSQRVTARARLGAPRGGDLTAAVLSAIGPPSTVGGPSWTQLAAARLRAGLQLACRPLPAAPGGLLPGLVIGDTSRLDPALADKFRTTGLTHLVAVSGANVAIILGVVLFVARWCRARPWVCALVCAGALVGFVILARPSPSVIRAAAMGGIALIALASGRSRTASPALAAAVVAGLLIDPSLAMDAGFALSVLATGALILLAPGWRDALVARGVPPLLAEAVAVPAAAQLACGPVIVALSGQVSLVAVPANLLAAPAVAPATLFGVGSAVVSPLWPDAAQFLAWLAAWPARWLVTVATTGARVPDGAIPWPAGAWGGLTLAALTVGLVLVWRWPLLRRLVVVATLAVAVGALPVRWAASGWPPDGAVIVACDVGQGDALVLPEAAGVAVVVDTGPDPEPIDGCLTRLGIDTVSVLVITHFHADHVDGIGGVLAGRRVGRVILPLYGEPAAGRQRVLDSATADRVPVGPGPVGWRYAQGWLDLRIIGPAQELTGTRSDPNNNSLVLRVVSRGVSMLLAGDAETEEQADLLTTVDRADLRADVLKVAHHGSLYQDPELLDAVHPLVALVSVGAGNPYGHPNLGLLARLAHDGARVLRTDLFGDVAVVTTANGPAVVVSHEAPATVP